MASNSSNPKSITAANYGGLKYFPLDGLVAFDSRPYESLPEEPSSDDSVKYHKTLNEIRLAYMCARAGYRKDHVPFDEIEQLNSRIAKAIKPELDLRMVRSSCHMASVGIIWTDFKEKQVTKRGADAMKTLYCISE